MINHSKHLLLLAQCNVILCLSTFLAGVPLNVPMDSQAAAAREAGVCRIVCINVAKLQDCAIVMVCEIGLLKFHAAWPCVSCDSHGCI